MSLRPQPSWVWKFEPISPRGISAGVAEEDLGHCDDRRAKFFNADSRGHAHCEKHRSRAQVATKLLEELDEYIKEEPFSDWLEEEIELPIFEDLPAPADGYRSKLGAHAHNVVKVHAQQQDTTQTLLREFESVLGDVEACHQICPPINSTLTPPQSPPPNKLCHSHDIQHYATLQPVLNPRLVAQSDQQQLDVQAQENNVSSYLGQISGEWNAENISLVPLRDVVSELAAVDEYVRSCAKDIAPTSPCTSSGGSCISSEDSSSIDEPKTIVDTSSDNINSDHSSIKERSSRSSKNRQKPYSRPTVENKKVRKKEQNKNAATRYRQKKKQEIKEIAGEEQELLDHNVKLRDQITELNREIGYLKGLMRDLFKVKGLIK